MNLFKYLNTKLSKRPSFESVLTRRFSDPEELCNFVARHTRYKADPYERDHWQTPEETWKRGLGDCEDLSLVVDALCAASGFDREVTAVFGVISRTGHIYVKGYHLNRRWVYSNNAFRWIREPETCLGFVLEQIGMANTRIAQMPLLVSTIEAMTHKPSEPV